MSAGAPADISRARGCIFRGKGSPQTEYPPQNPCRVAFLYEFVITLRFLYADTEGSLLHGTPYRKCRYTTLHAAERPLIIQEFYPYHRYRIAPSSQRDATPPAPIG